MIKLEVFFDYVCPFCLKGHKNLVELLEIYPEIKIVWCPCESHPRPESHGYHSDLAIQGMFFVLENGYDIWAYHDLMYKAGVTDRLNIEDIDVLCNIVSEIVDVEKFRLAISNREYEAIQQDGNSYAFEKSGVFAVPSYRMNGKKLDSILGVGVTKIQLNSFLSSSTSSTK